MKLNFIKRLFRKKEPKIYPIADTRTIPEDSEPEQKSESHYGTHGRLEIPDLAISVPLNGIECGPAQKVIDLEDSAIYLNWPNQTVIADHCHQGNFSNLNQAIPGQTKAFILEPDSKKSFVCYQTQIGHIKIGEKSNILFDHDWIPVYKSNVGGLTMYTCIEKSSANVMDVRVTYWKEI